MIESLKKIGELVVKKELGVSELDEYFWNNLAYRSIYLISEEAFNFEYFNEQVKNELEKPHIIYINLKTSMPPIGLTYAGVELKEAYSKDNNNWIRKEAIGGVYYSPTIPLEISTKKDSMKKKAKSTYENLVKTLTIGEKETQFYPNKIKDFTSNLVQVLNSYEEGITNEITALVFKTFLEVSISKKKINIIVSLKIDDQTLKNNDILSQYLFHRYIVKNFKTKNAFNDYGSIIWNNSNEKMICSVCSRVHQNITTEYKPYTFYSNDKRSYNTNSNLSTSGKMFPIDIQCAYLVEIGRCYTDLNFEFEFGGDNFKLIPKILFPDPYQEKILDLRINYENLMKKEPRINRINQEKVLLSVLEDFNNTINYDMIFYEKTQSEFKILLHIKDVSPSRIKKIHDAFNESRKMGTINRNFGNLISFNTIKRFHSRYEGKSIKYDNEAFFEMLNVIFSGEEVKKSHILSAFFSNFQNKIFKAKESPVKARQTEIHAALLIFEFLKQLNLLNW